MSTDRQRAAITPGDGGDSTSRIVRTGRLAWSLGPAAVLVATVLGAFPHDAWMPSPGSGAGAPWRWSTVVGGPDRWLGDAQLAAGAWLSPANAVLGGIVVATLFGAAVLAVLVVTLRTAGLPALQAALLALVAATAPLLAWHASSPLGAGPLLLMGVLALWAATGRARPAAAPGAIDRATPWPTTLMLMAAATAIAASWLVAPEASRSTVALLAGELGAIGLTLAAAPLLPAPGRTAPPRLMWAGAVTLWLLTTPLSPPTRAGVMVPWGWWLVASGLATLLHVRERRASQWAVAGLSIWIALHAWQRPWGEIGQQVALVRTWADGLATQASAAHPIVDEPSARGRLVRALATRRAAPGAPAPIVAADQVRASASAGTHPLVISAAQRDRTRWVGVGLWPSPPVIGATLDQVIDALPRGTIVVAGISRRAAARMTPRQWQSLGRLGLRLTDAGAARAHALVGVTGARVEALEAVSHDDVRLDVTPGDPIGRTGVRAPIDARVEADATRVRLFLRDRPLLDEAGLAVAVFTTRGELLAWRSGLSPDGVSGPALGGGAADLTVVQRVLPCLDAPAQTALDVTAVSGEGALGLTMAADGEMVLRLWRPDGMPSARIDRIDDAGAPASAAITSAEGVEGAGPEVEDRATLRLTARSPAGVLLRGAVARAEVRSATPVRVCAAWPTAEVIDVEELPVEMPMAPRLSPYLGAGWHDIEPLRPGSFFRWMAGPRASLLLPVRARGAIRFVLDAQAVAAPRAADRVQLTVNDRPVGARVLLPTRGLYEWTVPADARRAGPDRFLLDVTLAVRPADVTPGADQRQLGLLVYGWSVGPASAAARPTEPRHP